jgi:cyclase
MTGRNGRESEDGGSTMGRWTCLAPTGARRTRFGEVPSFAEGLYDLGSQIYAWMVPNGAWGESNAGLVVGQGASLLVDTLWDLDYTRAMLDAMRPLTDTAPLAYVVNTHADGDHWWGNQLVTSAEIITSTASRREMLALQPQSLLLLRQVGRLLSALKWFGAEKVGRWFQNMVAPYNFARVSPTPAGRTFEGELSLEVGGRRVQLIEAGHAHTHGDVLVYVPEARVLFSGDLLFVGSTPVMWAGPPEAWLAALDRILAMDVDVVVPGHGPVTGKAGVQQLKAYWQYLVAEVGQRHNTGMSARDAAYDLALGDDFARQPFSRWNSPERIMTNVHTIYRHLEEHTAPLTQLQMVNVLRQQALLAHQLPHAQPAVMRRG